MDRMIQRAARIKWRDILEMARERMTLPEVNSLASTIARNEQTIDEWIDNLIEPGAIKWLVDLSDGDGKKVARPFSFFIFLFFINYYPTSWRVNRVKKQKF